MHPIIWFIIIVLGCSGLGLLLIYLAGIPLDNNIRELKECCEEIDDVIMNLGR